MSQIFDKIIILTPIGLAIGFLVLAINKAEMQYIKEAKGKGSLTEKSIPLYILKILTNTIVIILLSLSVYNIKNNIETTNNHKENIEYINNTIYKEQNIEVEVAKSAAPYHYHKTNPNSTGNYYYTVINKDTNTIKKLKIERHNLKNNKISYEEEIIKEGAIE